MAEKRFLITGREHLEYWERNEPETWIVAAYMTIEQAEDHLSRLNAIIESYKAEWDEDYEGIVNKRQYVVKKYSTPLDPKLIHHLYNGDYPTYAVTEIPVYRHLDEYLENNGE